MNNIRQLVLNYVSKGQQRPLICKQTYQGSRWRCTFEMPPVEKRSIAQEKVTPRESLFKVPKGIMGQPTCHTHPHMVPDLNHLTYGVTQAEYRDRRETLIEKLLAEYGNQYRNHFVIIPAASKQYMSDKIPYVFRQNSDFYYLTGCLEPSAVLLLVKPAQTEAFRSVLFVHEKDAHAEMWEGPRTGCGAAPALFAVDEARPVDSFPNYLKNILINSRPSTTWYHAVNPANSELNSAIRNIIGSDTGSVLDPQRALHWMRAVKSPAEVALMKETCSIGARAQNMAMACTKPGLCESSLLGVLEYASRHGGAEHLAFPPVIAGGAASTHIHYIANNQILDERDMVLIDSGSQRWLYNSDLSRTFPVSGKFSTHHKILYELILTLQKRLLGILAEYRPPLDLLFDNMCRLLGRSLQEEGILSKNLTNNELITSAYKLCPHHVSHYLGLDVHDTPLIKRNLPVINNMVVTVEPGIYIQPNDVTVPKEFRGIGIRIEDDVLITETDCVNLTEECVKEVQDIEALVGTQNL